MYKLIPTLFFIIFTLTGFAQNYTIKWGDALKLKKGTADLEIVHADKTGYYFVEGKIRKSDISLEQQEIIP
ncbi:MAG: hypothetical protein ACOYKE_11485 [Ferruginibacter sp.]